MGMGMLILKEYDKLAESGGKISPEFTGRVNAIARGLWEKAVENGTEDPISIEFFNAEAHGTACPVCGKAPDIQEIEKIYRGVNLGIERFYHLDCDCEENHRRQKADSADLQERIERCRIPQKYLLMDWNDWDTGVHQELTASFHRVREYSFGQGLQSLLNKLGVCLYGQNGRGKTMAGVCLLKSILQNTKLRCRFVPMAEYTRLVINSGGKDKLEQELKSFDVLYLDDVDKISTESKWVQQEMFSLFDTMYREGKTIIMSTNLLTIADIKIFFQSSGEAIVSRMVEGMEFARFIEGTDYREKKRANSRVSG